jgi:hypothetical protein
MIDDDDDYEAITRMNEWQGKQKYSQETYSSDVTSITYSTAAVGNRLLTA